MKRKAVSFLFATVLTGTLNQAFAAQEPDVNWRMQALWDAGTTPYKFEEKFVKKVAELTNNHFKIKLFSGGQLVPSAKAFSAVRAGAFQLMKTYDGYEAGNIPTFAFTGSVPFGFEQPEDYESWFYDEGGLQLVRKAYGNAGLYYIAPTIYGAEPIHSKTPINTIADLAGKKGRFVGLASTVMSDLGVVTTGIPTAEVYQALEKGVIDIADRGDLTANYEAGLYEVTPYLIMPGYHQPTTATSYVANQRAYDKLPDSYKKALETAAKETSHELRDFIREQDSIAMKNFEAKGVTILTPDPEEVKAYREKALQSWKKAAGDDALANEVLDSQIKSLKKKGLL